MYFRYDTYHDSVQKNKSVGALVASINGTFTKFVSTAEFHSSPTEMTDRMCPMVLKALRRYNEQNTIVPERVIMYRYLVI